MLKFVMAALACLLAARARRGPGLPEEADPAHRVVRSRRRRRHRRPHSRAGDLQEKLGQPVVIENKPGAAGTLGNELVARAEKDGYTLGIMTAGQIIAAMMNKSLRYDTATAFEPISQVGTASLIIVARRTFPPATPRSSSRPRRPIPARSTVASPGFGATQHMSAELFRQTAGIDMVHVPFRTSPEAITAVLGKQVDVLFDTVLAVIGQVQSGQLKAIAVTGKDGFPVVPNVPPADRVRHACPVTTSPPGTASSRRAARRRKSSPSSTRR